MLCKRPRTFKNVSLEAPFACGQCNPCRINTRRVWTHRIMLEGKYHLANSFLTCTYDDDHLPKSYVHPKTGQIWESKLPTCSPTDHKQFMDRFRENYWRVHKKRLRFYGVGEYGDDSGRPHYHYALFNYPACVVKGARIVGKKFIPCWCYDCQFISKIWGKGNIFLGDLTNDSAQYVAKYVLKKMTSDKTEFQKNYLQGRYPEFSRMSNKPGLGLVAVDSIAQSLTQYGVTAYPDLPRTLNHGSKKVPLGRYLNNKLDEKMGFQFSPGEKLKIYETQVRDLLLSEAKNSCFSGKAVPSSVQIAMQMLCAQKVLNQETKLNLYKKGSVL